MSIRLGQDVLDSLVDYTQIRLALRQKKSLLFRHVERPRTGVDRIGVLVGNLDAEFLLNSHDDFYGVEGVEAKVVGKVSNGLDLFVVRCGNTLKSVR